MRLGLRKLSLPGLAVLLATIALLASGCQIGGGGSSSGPSNLAKNQVYNPILYTAGGNDVTTMDPQLLSDAVSLVPTQLVFEGLLELDKDGNVINWDAKSVDVSTDLKTYTFHLRDNLFFSNGKAITANDFAYSINRAMNPCLASPLWYYVGTLLKDAPAFNSEKCSHGTISGSIQTLIGDSLVVNDPKTLVITLSAPGNWFLDGLTYPTSYAVDQTVIGSDPTSEAWQDQLKSGATGQGGGGMFYVASWDHSTGMDLKVNPHWTSPDGKKPILKEIDWHFFKDASTAYNAYQTNLYDYSAMDSSQEPQAKSSPDFHIYPTLTYFGYDFNWNQPPWNNLDARVAFCLAVDRDVLVSSIYHGIGVATWQIIPKGMPGYVPPGSTSPAAITGPDGVTATTGDQAKALQHWQAYLATLNGKPVPPISFTYTQGTNTDKQFAEGQQAQWKQVLNVNVTLKGESFTQFLKDTAFSSNFNSSYFGWIDDYPHPQDFLTGLLLTGTTYNTQNASVPAADTLMKAADAAPTLQAGIPQYLQAEQLLINQVATCPVYQSENFYVVRPYVKGYFEAASGVTPLTTWDTVYITTH